MLEPMMMAAEGRAASLRMPGGLLAGAARLPVIAILAFLTVVDLFAAQAILPRLVAAYGVPPAAMGFAVNASTIGMAVGALGVSLFSRRIDKRRGILLGLGLLAIPTTALASLPDLTTFTLLRIAQGLCMATAFTLTLGYLGERNAGSSAFAAYVTGNVASNLFGRLISAGVAEHFGLAANFYGFAALNLCGVALAAAAIRRGPAPRPAVRDAGMTGPSMAAWPAHLRNPALRAAFGIGFCILFAFIGTFTFVNFVLVRPPLSLDMMQVGAVYAVFLPSILTTPVAGAIASRVGLRRALCGGLLLALAGMPLLLWPALPPVLAGMVLAGVGTFFAQAVATGLVSRAATGDRAAASGLYLAAYFLGGLAGTAILGQVFDRVGWSATVAGIALSLAAALALAARVRPAVAAP